MKSFTIHLNGKEKEIFSKTLAMLLVDEGLNGSIIATAVNGVFIPVIKRSELQLAPNDKVEIVLPMQGG